MRDHDLAYWKARKVTLRDCIAAASPLSSYWADLQQAYRYACHKVEEKERRILIKRLEQ